MGLAMPTHLEKAPTLTIMEQYFNGRYPKAPPRRDILLHALEALRSSNAPGDWLGRTLPDLWNDPAILARIGTGNDPRTFLTRNWFGLPPTPGALTTGFWIGYQGDVESIVRTALIWALELALGLSHEGDACDAREDPWLLELSWVCGIQWFETWVSVRPSEVTAPAPTADRGVVSVMFLTPTHRGSTVATSQIARSAKAGGPIPGSFVPSTQNDYEVLEPAKFRGQTVPRVAAHERQYATWIVSAFDHHRELIPGVDDNTSHDMDIGVMGLAQFGRYRAESPTILVSPSLPSGGVTYHGVIA
jgi:hypothetical protein